MVVVVVGLVGSNGAIVGILVLRKHVGVEGDEQGDSELVESCSG